MTDGTFFNDNLDNSIKPDVFEIAVVDKKKKTQVK